MLQFIGMLFFAAPCNLHTSTHPIVLLFKTSDCSDTLVYTHVFVFSQVSQSLLKQALSAQTFTKQRGHV